MSLFGEQPEAQPLNAALHQWFTPEWAAEELVNQLYFTRYGPATYGL